MRAVLDADPTAKQVTLAFIVSFMIVY